MSAAPNSGRSVAAVSDEAAADAAEVGSREDPAAFLGLSTEVCIELLRQMIVSRRFEEKAAEVYQVGKIGGFCHLYTGQEAVAVGAISPLREDDYVITAYREHTQAIVRGMTPGAVMAELYGRVDGCSKGFGGSMHMFDASLNFMGGHGIVGSHLPLAIGAGYAIRYRGGDQVCLCFFGDSVVNIGAFHESMNMAARWKLPVIFLLENNQYGMGTDFRRVAAVKELKDRGRGYEGLTSLAVDGMDVLAVREAVQEAIERARDEKTPSFIEVRCFRYMGHSMADPSHGTYRTREEVEKWRSDDPILSFSRRLIEAGRLTEEEYEALDRESIEVAEEAAAFADRSPFPDPEAAYRYVYSDGYPDDMRRRDAWRKEFR
ncbi:pyruvate dehydrogenase (acetyl-transferring) E1 component subunit alpha [Candidatus Palauibacter sp.]|uniref:pyruvate dehydrogenase (acetyl-transferring) E1 component subunit alpha n=1 Tax=Candidatus Palauibacter sp. TaxID=3101350 RepID=UPI003B021852